MQFPFCRKVDVPVQACAVDSALRDERVVESFPVPEGSGSQREIAQGSSVLRLPHRQQPSVYAQGVLGSSVVGNEVEVAVCANRHAVDRCCEID
ncbi:MAG: hypothetical protein AAGA45_03070 [Verrucomicrobiota bacterium]